MFHSEQATPIDYIKQLFQQKSESKSVEQSSDPDFQQLFEQELKRTKQERQKKKNFHY